MAIVLKPKRSATAAKVPTTTDLASGELGVNMADRKIYINNGTAIVQVGAGLLSALGDVDMTGLSTGNSISWDGTKWVASSAGAGTVTSVAISGGTTGLTTSGGPITTNGTITLAGTLAVANGGTGATSAANARTNLGLAIGTNVQAWDADLDAIAALAGTSGLLRKTAANTWSLDTNSYLTGNQSISLSGDASGSGTTSIAVTLANSGVTAGTYTKVTVDAKGRVTAGASLASADLPTYTGTLTSSQVTTALGYTPYNSTNPNGYTSNTGTVTSVALSLPAIFSVSGSPVTTSGTLSASLASQTANTVWAAPNGSAGAPSFRALVAADIPVLTLENLPDAWVKRSVRVATTANITLSGTQTIDGVAVVAGDRVLVKDQTAAAENGIYVVAAGAWSRAADANVASKLAAATVGVDSGTANGGLSYDCDFRSTDTLGTTAMTWYRAVDAGLASSTSPAMNGTVAVGTSISYARADHVHPTDTSRAATNQTFFLGTTSIAINRASAAIALTGITSIDGSAATLTTGRTIAMTGDVSYTSGSFNGSANVTGTATIADATVSGKLLTGYTAGTNTALAATDSILAAFGKVQGQINARLTGNQTITLSGDASGSGATAITVTLANSGVTAGTYTKVTVDAKGRVTAGASLASADLPTYTGTLTSSQVTTALGYTPYNSSNPSGYITSSALSSYLPLSGGTITTSGSSASLSITDTGANGANLRLNGNGATTPNKTIRAQNGNLQIINSAYSAPALTLTDGGELTTPGNHIINNASPTVYLQDTDHMSAMLHCNSNLFYVLRGAANSLSWTQVNGQWPLTIDLSNNNATVGGSFTAVGNVTAYSDERLKKDWQDLGADFVERIASVRAGLFTRTDNALRQIGVSAQSLLTVSPESVIKGRDGYLSVNYGNVALAAAIALAQRVLQLEARIDQLQANAA